MVMSTIYQGGRGLASFELHVYIYIHMWFDKTAFRRVDMRKV